MNNLKRYGTEYGGFYLPINLDLHKDSIVYCFGAGEDISFDVDISSKYNCIVHVFDPTPRAIEHVKSVIQNKPPSSNLHRYGGNDTTYMERVYNKKCSIKLYEYGVHVKDDNIIFYFPSNSEYVSLTSCDELRQADNSISLEVKSIRTIMKDLQHNTIDLLKLDIEGVECEVLIDLFENLKIFPKYVCVDFDARRANKKIELFENVCKLLKLNGYKLLINRNYDISFEKV